MADEDAPDKRQKRFELFVKLFQVFADYYAKEFKPPEELRMNYVQLYNIVESYFQDIDRYKQYHFENPSRGLINDAKKAAFTVKWIIRIRPLYIHNEFSIERDSWESFEYDDLAAVINELFALYVAQCFLQVALTHIKFAELLYILRYRCPDEYMLMTVFQMLVDLRDGDSILAK